MLPANLWKSTEGTKRAYKIFPEKTLLPCSIQLKMPIKIFSLIVLSQKSKSIFLHLWPVCAYCISASPTQFVYLHSLLLIAQNDQLTIMAIIQ